MKKERLRDIKKIRYKLENGEPFYYIESGGADKCLLIGVRMGYDEEHDEIIIFECENWKEWKRILKKEKDN